MQTQEVFAYNMYNLVIQQHLNYLINYSLSHQICEPILQKPACGVAKLLLPEPVIQFLGNFIFLFLHFTVTCHWDRVPKKLASPSGGFHLM